MKQQSIFTSAIKRTGEKVPYNNQKITNCLIKAFASSDSDKITEQEILQLVQQIEATLASTQSGPSIHIEHIQDTIEQTLMRHEYFTTAKNFIIYRQKHAEQRLTTTISKQQKSQSIQVIKRNGEKEPFNLNKTLTTLRHVSKDINSNHAPLDPIVIELEKNIYSNIRTDELCEALVLSTVSFIERDPGYDIIAARLLKQKIYKEVLKHNINPEQPKNYKAEFDKIYRATFVENIKQGVEKEYFNKELLTYDLEAIAEKLIIEQDDLIEYLGIRTLYERYFVKHETQCMETPQAFWMRVAMGLAIQENNKIETALKFYKLISNLRYIPSTPTLFHAGLTHPQLSSCYISTISDDLSHIFKCIGDNAQMAKWSGGIGNDWTPIRATNSHIKSTKVESQGVIPFLKIANDTTLAINRSGKRRGATCAYLENWHLDIEDFLDLRRNTGDERRRTHDMNTAVWIPDLFMKRVESKEDWTLFSPDETPDLHEIYGAKFEAQYIQYEKLAEEGKINNYKKISALKLWRKMLTRLFETGHPWITFKDPCNIRSPQDHVGVIHSSNLCTEITLNNSAEETAVCNLGSINLGAHIENEGLNQFKLMETIKTAIHMLDNVIDINFYPTIEAKNSNLKHRPIGLGLMGLQDALYKLHLPFTGTKTQEFVDTTMEFISYHAILASSELAKEKGAYPSFKGSKWDRGIFPFDTLDILEKERNQKVLVNRNQSMNWEEVKAHVQQYGMRNSNIMAIAPTATISNIAGCYPCIEPIYKNIYVKANMSGEFTIVNRYLVNDLKRLGLWNTKMLEKIKYYDGNISYIEEIPEDIKNLYLETFEIDSIDLIRLTAIRAKWIDQSQSHNVFIKGESGKKLQDTYMQAWKQGLKTTYYLRSLGASQIEKSTLDAKEYGYTQKRVYHTDETQNKEQALLQPTSQSADILSETSTTAQNNSASTMSANNIHTTTTIEKKTEETTDDFQLPATNTAVTACSILDPECEACQ